ncbi:AAA family ATPase [Priestia megaterium]
MKENKLYLQFKDNVKEIEFDLNKNTVFFGNNGQGKTRILRTINSLYELSKEKNKENFPKIIDSMNLDKLKINGVNYDSLFSENEKFKKIGTENFKRFLGDNSVIFERLSVLLNENLLDYLDNVSSRGRIGRILTFLEKFSQGSNTNYNVFGHWINELFVVINTLRNRVTHSVNFELDVEEKYSYITFVNNALTLTSHLKEKYELLGINSEDEELALKLKENSKSIMNNLSLKSARYITTDNIDITSIYKKIELEMSRINEELKRHLWKPKAKTEELDEFVLRKDNLFDKIDIFNQIINKYADISADIQGLSGLVFSKNGDKMAFEKLSSGERKITYLFLEILLNDVDIYLIDEPELSLSLNFQNKIITDLHILTRGKRLFIATHAPYIYEDFVAIEGNITKEV